MSRCTMVSADVNALLWCLLWLPLQMHCERVSHVTIADGCSTVVLIGCTCPAMTVVTVILRALDRVRERALGCFARSPDYVQWLIAQIPSCQAEISEPIFAKHSKKGWAGGCSTVVLRLF